VSSEQAELPRSAGGSAERQNGSPSRRRRAFAVLPQLHLLCGLLRLGALCGGSSLLRSPRLCASARDTSAPPGSPPPATARPFRISAHQRALAVPLPSSADPRLTGRMQKGSGFTLYLGWTVSGQDTIGLSLGFGRGNRSGGVHGRAAYRRVRCRQGRRGRSE